MVKSTFAGIVYLNANGFVPCSQFADTRTADAEILLKFLYRFTIFDLKESFLSLMQPCLNFLLFPFLFFSASLKYSEDFTLK